MSLHIDIERRSAEHEGACHGCGDSDISGGLDTIYMVSVGSEQMGTPCLYQFRVCEACLKDFRQEFNDTVGAVKLQQAARVVRDGAW